jgi:Calcium-binding EGF domain/EGF-like domain
VNYCSANSTCVNLEDEAKCECKHGFINIANATRRLTFPALQNVECLSPKDVNYCALGLTNCSNVAVCASHVGGYNCTCPAGYVDGNPASPGRVCAARLCDLCNQHGDWYV